MREIDRSDKSDEWLEEEAGLKREAMVLFLRSRMLLEAVDKIYKSIVLLTEEYPEERELGWEEKEELISKSDKLDNELNISMGHLNDMDDEYDIIREKVNKFYGEEVYKNIPKTRDLMDIMMEEEGDGYTKKSDWWKNE